MNIHYAITGGS